MALWRSLTDRDAAPGATGSWLRYHGARVGLLIATAALTYLLFPAAPAVQTPIWEVGSVAASDVIAPFGFLVPKSPEELTRERDELARSVKPVLVYRPAALDSSLAQLRQVMDSVAGAAEPRRGRTRPDSLAVMAAARRQGLDLSPAEASYLGFPVRRRAMSEAVARVFRRWLSAGVAASGSMDDMRGEVIVRRGDTERNVLSDSVLTFGSLLARARLVQPDRNSSVADGLYLKLLSTLFRPTLRVDRQAMEARRQALRASVDTTKYRVRVGEKIIGRAEVVGRAEYDKLRALHQATQLRRGGQRQAGRVAGAVAYDALVLAIFGIALVLFRPALYRSFRSLTLLALLFLTVLASAAAAALAPNVRPELIPVAFAAIILSVLFDPRISMIAAMILAVLAGGQSVYRGTNALFLNLLAGAAAALSVRVIRRRDQAYYSILVVGAAYVSGAVAIGLTLGWGAGEMARSSMWGVLNAVVSVSLGMLLLPLAERLAHVTTDLTLLEYSDLNRPLLKRLSMEAPGTYQHTMAVAVLAEAACDAIGANGLLARVGTYYHDIGKLKKPQYFVENQTGAGNPHDKLKPLTSAGIIRNHVREGMELADEYRLPPVIKAFIAEHHGTGSIAYFLDKARERDGEVTNPSDFGYPGPVPQTAETAVCMLADGVDASVRVLQDPTPERIRDVVDHIVRQRMEQGQLRHAPLTLRQLETVRAEFARVLIGRYHRRIDYPAATGGVTAEFSA